MNEKADECPHCGKALSQVEYDMQCCGRCGTGMDFAVGPTEADYKHMLHALGRPKSPLAKVTRNYYCAPMDSNIPHRFKALGWWDYTHSINHGSDGIFQVNDEGKRALAVWMIAKMEVFARKT